MVDPVRAVGSCGPDGAVVVVVWHSNKIVEGKEEITLSTPGSFRMVFHRPGQRFDRKNATIRRACSNWCSNISMKRSKTPTPLIGGVSSDHPILTDPALDLWRPAPVVVGDVLRDDCERLKAKSTGRSDASREDGRLPLTPADAPGSTRPTVAGSSRAAP